MENRKQINIGWAQVDITPRRPVMVYGQIYARVSTYVRDPLTATCMVLENGEDQAILISCDVTSPPFALLPQLRKNLEDIPGLCPEKISISAIHTHNAFSFGCGAPGKPLIDPAIQPYIEKPADLLTYDEGTALFTEQLTTLVRRAWENRAPGAISAAQDYAAIAFNRRPVFQRDWGCESKMYGDCSEDEFLRFEGPSDHAARMLYTWDLKGNLTGVTVDIPCPSQVFELHCFISADYWGFARKEIRDRLGNIPVLALCGAAGDQNPLDLVRISKTNSEALRLWNAQATEVFRNFDMTRECDMIGKRIAEAVARGYETAKNYMEPAPILRHTVSTLPMPIRTVTEEDYQEALEEIRVKTADKTPENRLTWQEWVKLFEPIGVVGRWNRQQKDTTFQCPLHTIRIDGVAMCFVPFELFVEFSFRIQARCKAENPMVIQLSNHSGGYLPTDAAIAGGSYSSKPASTTVGPRSGDLLVETLIDQINDLFAD